MNYEIATNDELEVKLGELIGMGKLGALNAPRYCTDWNATMPLLVGHKLSLIQPDHFDGETEWGCTSIYDLVGSGNDDNPLRAIVICLIKVLEAKQ